MKKIVFTTFALLSLIPAGYMSGASRQDYTVYVDDHGIMRRSDTGAEVSYYGTNYTVPFAHAYRALPLVGTDRKAVIDLDVAQMKRLGFNGFRLHLWDAELADAEGNLLSNDHLDLLDYMIFRLEASGIDIVLTAQTNFGNGYPERNIDTGAFTYDFDKCDIHANPKAQAIQERYLTQLAGHLNPYTGRTYAADRAIIGIEINNEPCHTAPAREVTKYIDRMAGALRRAGFDRIIMYNVSHNPDVTAAYYDADIQATTYQWYPDGLVAGHERQGNLLPYVDAYPIPWSKNISNYDRMARVVYEFDPGDVLCTYLYPAVVRTFRHQGFQWVTQFAYDPTPIARYNTEYQTHFLNLLYTPGKALGMMIAGEAMRRLPLSGDFGTYPADTVFKGDNAHFEVSYPRDLSMMTAPESFIYTNDTETGPASTEHLRHIAGVGCSPLVSYPGTGAYFIDRLEDTGAWRLEVMPDVAIYEDPFEKTSLRRPVASLYYATRPMQILLPGLSNEYLAMQIADGEGHIAENESMKANSSTISVEPGVYILANDEASLSAGINSADASVLSRYCAPRALTGAESAPIPSVEHTPPAYININEPLSVRARVLADNRPVRVMIYPADISFWREENTLYEMHSRDGVNYTATIPTESLREGFRYNIVVETDAHGSYTYPARSAGTPLDWDVITTQYYVSSPAEPDDPFILYTPEERDKNLDVAMIPEEYSYRWRVVDHAPYGAPTLELNADPHSATRIAVRAYVGDRTDSQALRLEEKRVIEVITGRPLPEGTTLSVTTSEGLTYTGDLTSSEDGRSYSVDTDSCRLAPTLIIPAPYPTFLPREFIPAADSAPMHPNPAEIEFVMLNIPAVEGVPVSLSLAGIILRK